MMWVGEDKRPWIGLQGCGPCAIPSSQGLRHSFFLNTHFLPLPPLAGLSWDNSIGGILSQLMVTSQGGAVPEEEHVEAAMGGQGFHIPDVFIKGSEISKRLLLSFRSVDQCLLQYYM